ncbi:MAG: aldehyde dehydrogenase family protein [Telmatospirillum sp.]|nr:aldehyde dehydrogenase family protein [Telmatospirillum sp.]
MSDAKSDSEIAQEAFRILRALGAHDADVFGGSLPARSPISGEFIGSVRGIGRKEAEDRIGSAHAAYKIWRQVPAPRRGELVRLLGEELRKHKAELGHLVTLETGKIASEGLGEVQEMIDICDFAVGLSRQLYGLTIATERREHRMMETWHPIGVCGVISAFNFPVAVWSWNAALALVCGDAVVWKPSEKTLLSALAVQAIVQKAIARFGAEAPEGLCALLIGGRELGEVLVDDPRVPVVSATGSTAMGRAVGPKLAQRFARAILELGGNNAAIVAQSADQDLALRAVAFAAMGTAGQRCTTLRRLFVHRDIYQGFVSRLARAYGAVAVGDPRRSDTLVGPLIDRHAFEAMEAALNEARGLGGTVHGGGRVAAFGADAYYARPALVEMRAQAGPMFRETFAPILYVMPYDTLEEGIELNNAVGVGLSSSVFTRDMREAEIFVSATGSDCGIANVNIGPSGAEIGGAFGGEKETGGGREAGSDAWKAYMRRATNTVNYGTTLPLAQGVAFDIAG